MKKSSYDAHMTAMTPEYTADLNRFDQECNSASNHRLSGRTITFEPHDPKSVDSLLGEFGPEGLYEIAEILRKAADEDMDAAYRDSISKDI